MISIRLFVLCVTVCSVLSFAQVKIEKVEPPEWWVGMKLNKIQLMVYGEDLSGSSIRFSNDKIQVIKVHDIANSSYAFVDIEIPPSLTPGVYQLIFTKDGASAEFSFPINKRETGLRHQGFNQEDVIYLITPDRFVNGDQSNDVVDGYINSFDRSSGTGRHGGDIQGIIDQLDYIKETGFTALWLNPVVENNSPVSYHGYGATDFYKVDPRFGTNELYKKMIDEAHKKGLKVIFDHISNHIHINHPWMQNLPMSDWINHSVDDIEFSRHDKIAIVDVHADSTVLENSVTGWFTDYMPDLNQNNPYMANYIIQNTIWWMEFAGYDGIREDTYPYADPEFMAEWAKVILNEYPTINIVGEVWNGNPVLLATYQQNSKITFPFNTNLPAVTDFGVSDILSHYLRGDRNIHSVYETIAMDYTYYDPYNLVTFIDNHDIERAMYSAADNLQKFKLAFQILLTTRGIPQVLYGTEIGIKGGSDHGSIRSDFPGGFPEDERNAFTEDGRTDKENEIYNFFKKMLEIRKQNKALAAGKLVHLPPQNNIYAYFRILDDEKIMIIINDNLHSADANLNLINHHLNGAVKLIDLVNDKEYEYSPGMRLTLPEREAGIYKIIF